MSSLADAAELVASDSLNNQHELESSDVAAGQENRANTQGHLGLVLTSSSEEEAGGPFRAGCPLSVALRSRPLPNAVRRLRHSGQGRNSPPRSLRFLTCRNDSSSVNRELIANAVTHAPELVVTLALTWLERSRALGIVVTDPSPLPPVKRDPGKDSEHGRGLQIVEALSARWGWQPRDPGKAVYAILAREA
jgi:hypothetical protein